MGEYSNGSGEMCISEINYNLICIYIDDSSYCHLPYRTSEVHLVLQLNPCLFLDFRVS